MNARPAVSLFRAVTGHYTPRLGDWLVDANHAVLVTLAAGKGPLAAARHQNQMKTEGVVYVALVPLAIFV
jgi:hypothetical protein